MCPEDKKFVSNFPYLEMSKNGWVSATPKKEERVFELRKFFEVTKLSSIMDEASPIACRRMAETEKGDFALLACQQKAKIEARNIETKLIDVQKLQESLPAIRSMTLKNPVDFCPQLSQILKDCGIAIVYLPNIGGSFLHGATFIDNKKLIIGMTVRGKDADRFWFSLFHEFGHILLGHVFNNRSTTKEEEKAADTFSRDTLIPQKDYENFVDKYHGQYNDIIIKNFATQIGISPGIVVGRLQNQNEIEFSWFNHLKEKYMLNI